MSTNSAAFRTPGALRFSVHVHPGSSVSLVGGEHGGALQVRVRARAVDGAATKEVCFALAKAFEVRAAEVQCVRGQRSRTKLIAIEGDVEALAKKLEILLQQA